MIRLWNILLLCLIPYALPATSWESQRDDGFRIQLDVNPLSLEAHQQIDIRILAHFPKGYTLNLNELREHLERDNWKQNKLFHVVREESSSALIDPDGGLTQQIQYRVEPWATGKHSLSFDRISFYPQSEAMDTVSILSELFEIEVKTGELSSYGYGKLHPLFTLQAHPDISLSEENRRELIESQSGGQKSAERAFNHFRARQLPWKLLSKLLVACLIGWCLLRIWKRHTAAALDLAQLRIDPRTEALKALADLQQQGLPEKGLFDRFYVTLTDIVRVFVERSYGIQAPEQTTEEFLNAIRENDTFANPTKEALHGFLNAADLVKFARHLPTEADCSDASDSAAQFVDSTH